MGGSDLQSLVFSVLGILSSFGSLLVIFSYWLFKRSRSLSRFLVCILSFCDFCQGLFYPMNQLTSGCLFLTPFGIWSSLTSFFWTACIAYFVNRVIRNPETGCRHYMKIFHIVSWSYPSIFGIALIVKYSQDPAFFDKTIFPWCYLGPGYIPWRLFSINIPLFVCWILTTAWYFSAAHRILSLARIHSSRQSENLSPERKQATAEILKEVRNKLIFIPSFFIFQRVWDAVSRLIEMFDSGATPEWLVWVAGIANSSQGITNCLVFVIFTKRIRDGYLDLLCCRRIETADDSALLDAHIEASSVMPPQEGI